MVTSVVADESSAGNPAAIAGNRSIVVLQLGQEYILDLMLLVQVHAQLEEIQSMGKTTTTQGTTKELA